MDPLPQGRPRNWRRTVRSLKTDPRHGGPPASDVGHGPDDSPPHCLGLPLPNFKGQSHDGMPCYINHNTIHEYWLNNQDDPEDFPGGEHGLAQARRDMKHLKRM